MQEPPLADDAGQQERRDTSYRLSLDIDEGLVGRGARLRTWALRRRMSAI